MTDFTFEGNESVADVNTIPEKYRGLYAEGQNDAGETVFALADSAKGLVADYLGTTRSLASAKNDKTKASDESAKRRQSLKAFDDLVEGLGVEVGDDGVATAIAAFITELQGKVKNGEEVNVNLDKIKADFEKRVGDMKTAHDTEIQERDGALSRHLISDAASRALAGAKGSIELLLPHVQNQCKVVRDDDGTYSVRVLDAQGDARMDSAGGWMGVDGLVSEMKNQDTFNRAFESEVKSGTGPVPGSMKSISPAQKAELSPTEKIRAGLQKGQAKDGRGS